MTTLVVNDGSLLTLDSPVPATDTILFTGAAGELSLIGDFASNAGTLSIAAPLVGFTLGDSILLTQSAPITAVTFTQLSATQGTLGLFNGTELVAALTLDGHYTGDNFALTDGYAPQINLLEPGTFGLSTGTGTANAYIWQGPSGGDYGDAANWGATAAPGTSDSATIAGAASGAFLLVTGPGSAASLEIDGLVALNGANTVGVLTLGTQDAATELLLASPATLSAQTLVASAGQIAVSGSAATVSVAGPVLLGGAALIVADGAQASLGSWLTLAGGAVDALTGGEIAIGTTSNAPNAINIAAGATLTGYGVIDASDSAGLVGTLVDSGRLVASGGALITEPWLTGAGTIEVQNSAALTLSTGVAQGAALDFQLDNNATLSLPTGDVGRSTVTMAGTDDTLILTAGLVIPPIAGFTLGDSLLVSGTFAANVASAALAAGTLELLGNDGSVLGVADMSGLPDGATFLTTSLSNTLVQINLAEADPYGLSAGTATPDSFLWTGPIGGAWGDPANWLDLSANGTGVAPGANNVVSLNGPTPTGGPIADLVIQGPGAASALLVGGAVALAGSFTADAMALAGDLLVGAGATLISSGPVALASGATLAASGGGRVQMGDAALATGGDVLVADTLSSIEIGATSAATALGQLRIDPGATLVADGTLSAPGGSVINGTLVANGTLTALGGALSGSGTVIVNGALLLPSDGIAAGSALTFVDNGALTVPTTIGSDNQVTLGASGVTLSFSGLIDGTMLAAPIAGLALGDVLQVTSSQYVMASSTDISGANTILNLLGAQGTIGSLLLADTTLTASVADTALTTGGYAVSLTAALPCYAAGTRIAIPGGEAPVETLKPGALVMTASGSCVPVRLVGHRHVSTSGHPSPEQLWPVRISAGAFADGRPRRDLFLSPDHAIWEAGVLLLARDLINGSSIMQVPMDQLTYWHIELDRHDLLLAEGLAAESYLDTGNRDSFAGGGEGKCRPRATAPYAERVLEGPLLSAVKARLFYRARCAPPPPSAPPALVADGIALPVLQKTPELWRAALPAAYDNIALVSSAWVPAEHFAPSLDRRRLGVRLFGAWADEQALPLDGPAFATGFYPTEITAEGACRWTNGTGRFDLPRGAHTLTLRLEPHPAG